MDYEVKTKKSLPNLSEQKTPSNKNVKEYILRALMVFVFTAVLSVSGQVIYDEIRYAPFIVDGESMYPILNYDTSVSDAGGVITDSPVTNWTLGDFNNPNRVYTVDYCYMDTAKKTLANIERFDIVVTYYSTDYSIDGSLKDDASLKVKRVIGLPGETVKFDTDGSLYIKGKAETDYSKVEQTFLTYEENKVSRPEVPESWYEAAMKETTNFTIEKTLDDNEYYVVGDNRRNGCSLDSRSSSVGPIKSTYLVGKAVTIAMKAQYVPGQSPKKIYKTAKMPWQLEIL